MSEYIGSRISLISKSDIKYIGTLHEINSDSHTVALESVTSYGTEGRKGNPAEEIAGSEHVYEYIVFRGSDVKELNIVAPPGGKGEEENRRPAMPDDPAILGSARPAPPPQQQQQQLPPQPNQFRGPPPPPYQQPQQFGYPPPPQFQNQPRFPGPGGPHGFPGSPGAVPGYGYPPPPGYGMGYGPPPGQGFQGPPPPGHFPPPNQQMPIGPPGQQERPPPHMQQQQQQQQPPIGSKQGTPQPAPQQMNKPPGLPAQPQQQQQPQQPQQPQKPIEMSGTPAPSATSNSTPAGPPPPIESKPPTSAALAPSIPATQAQPGRGPRQAPRANNRVAVPLPSPNVLAAKPPQRPVATAPQQAPAPQAQAPQTIQDATQAATAAVAAAMAKLNPNNRPQQDGVDNLAQKVNQMRVNDPQQQPYRGGRARGRGGPSNRGRRESAHKVIEVPKEDYDFESANAKFNKEDLVKEAIASGSPLTSPHANGEVADPLASANGHAEGEDDEDVSIPSKSAGGDKTANYNKKSSFFDDISSDLKDRTEGQTVDGRAMRRDERSRNMETFGQGSVDGGGYRGGFRGRGRGRGFRGAGAGRGFAPRGGERGNSGGGFRGRGRGGEGFEQAAPQQMV